MLAPRPDYICRARLPQSGCLGAKKQPEGGPGLSSARQGLTASRKAPTRARVSPPAARRLRKRRRPSPVGSLTEAEGRAARFLPVELEPPGRRGEQGTVASIEPPPAPVGSPVTAGTIRW